MTRILARAGARLVAGPGDGVIQFPKRQASFNNYKMTAKGDRGEIWLYGIIGADWFGDGITPKKFADDLRALGNVKTIDLRINSDGGVVTDARAIYNLLNEHSAKIIVHVDGIAASAASFIAMVGDEIHIAEGGFIMVHNARGVAWGEAEDMRRTADILDSANQTIRSTYMSRTGNDEAKIRKWMDSETWFSGKEAVENKFADKVVADKSRVAACLTDPKAFRNLPAALRPNRAAAAQRMAALRVVS